MLRLRTGRRVFAAICLAAATAALAGCTSQEPGARQPRQTGATAGTGGTDQRTTQGATGIDTGDGASTGMTSGSTGSSAGDGSTPPAPWELPGADLITQPASCQPGQVSVGPSPLRRISRIEYNNMVRDLLGDTTHPADNFVSETPVAGFNSNTYQSSSANALIARQYLEAAEALAANAVAGDNLTHLLPCATQADDACAEQFVSTVVKRAFRGQLDDTESAALLQLYQDVKAQFDFPTGIQAIITSMLTSPRFLFVLEFGEDAGGGGATVPLGSYEIASRLALYLWRSVPDQELMDAAAANQLASADQVEAQAARMLADAKAADALRDFANQWLDIENMDAVTKDTMVQGWSPALAKSLHEETLATYSEVVLAENGTFPDLLTSPSSYITSDLASFYGVAAAAASGPTQVDGSAHPRSGILTQGSFLSAHSHPLLPSPVLRGKIVRGNVLCRIPEPPDQIKELEGKIPPPPQALDSGQTIRDAIAFYETTSPCSGCHISIDAIGNAFGNYDTTGMLLPADPSAPGKFDQNGTPVDTSGTFSGISSDLDGKSFADAVEMIKEIAQSTQGRACFAVEQFRYASGRAETPADACSLQQIYGDFSTNGFQIQKLILAVVRSDAFRNRTAVNPGSACL